MRKEESLMSPYVSHMKGSYVFSRGYLSSTVISGDRALLGIILGFVVPIHWYKNT
jgi:hypothetical protein